MESRERRLAFSAERASSLRTKRQLAWGQAALAAALIGIAAAFLLNRVEHYQELAEKTAMETAVLHMRTGLRFRIVELLLHREEGKIASLVGRNPVEFLDPPLANFAGEFESSDLARVAGGHWYFVRDAGEIRYRPQRTRHFVRKGGGPPEVRLRVAAVAPRSDVADTGRGIRGVSLLLLDPYEWF